MGLVGAALAVGCSAGADRHGARSTTPVTIVVDGEAIEVAPLTEAVTGLCQARQEAAIDPKAAKATYDRRSRGGVDTTIRILRPSYSILASSTAEAVQRVEADMAGEPPNTTLAHSLARLTEFMRADLARLGITTAPCER